jgi:signal transduction histidine kinase/CheY-like chemotaxis protein
MRGSQPFSDLSARFRSIPAVWRPKGPPLDPDAAAAFQAEQVRALFRNVAPAVTAAAAGAASLSILLVRLKVLDWERATTWALYITLCGGAHLLLRGLFRHLGAQPGHLNRWTAIFAAICFAEGSGWGWASVSLVGPDEFDSKMLIMAITIAISAGSIPTFSPSLASLLAFFLSATVPYTLVSLTASNPMQRATSLMLMIYIATVGALGVFANRNFNELVRLRIQTSDLAESLRRQKEIAERANIAKSNFLAAASHDLRQPVHAVGLFVGALRNVAMPAVGVRLVEQIEASIAAMDSLFSAILDISRLDAGVVEVHPKPFAIQPMLDRICRDHADEAAAKEVALTCVPSSAVVEADPVLIERILRNLVSNAVRHTDRGRVVVGCRRGPALRIEVWDTGPGIPLDQQDRIFQEYVQIGNPERDRAKGLGLGLAIVRRLTELLGAELVLRSWPGRGSCFSVTAPLAVGGLDAAGDGGEASAGRLARGLIVVIDDETAILNAMAAVMTGWGYEVVAAGSGAEVLAQMAEVVARPDLIICDYRLRGSETGIEAIEALRSEYNALIPAMLITGDTAPNRLAEARASGLLLLHKPVPNGKLRAAVAHLMQWREDQPAEDGG